MKTIVSFGFRHGTPPNDGPIIDVRSVLSRNPFHNKKLRHLRGTDEEVQDDIRLTPFFADSLAELEKRIRKALAEHDIVYLACTGGHHRSVFMAEHFSKKFGTEVIHRDIDKK